MMKNFTFLKRFILAANLLLVSMMGALNAQTQTTYEFNNTLWRATPANWDYSTAIMNFMPGRGLQFTARGNTVSHAVTPVDFANVTSVTVTYCTNTSDGIGTISVYSVESKQIPVGGGTQIGSTFNVTRPASGTGLTLKTETFTATDPVSGRIRLQITCSENSVFIHSVTITEQSAVQCTGVPELDLLLADENNGNVDLMSDIADIGGCDITDYGFVYSATETSPTLENGTKVQVGTEYDDFETTIPDLCGTYYFVAYATNDAGTAYGEVQSLTLECCNVTPPVASGATDVLNESFTANWTGQSGNYKVTVYTKGEGTAVNETEGFNGITATSNGNSIEGTPAYLPGWTVSVAQSGRQIYTTTGNYGSSSPSIAFTATGHYVQTAQYDTPIAEFSFWGKGMTATNGYVAVNGFDGTNWQELETVSVDELTGNTVSVDFSNLSYDVYQIKLTYNKDLGNVAIDDIHVVTEAPAAKTIIADEDVTGTSFFVENLTCNTQYYYTVQAYGDDVCAGEISAESNEIAVVTAPCPAPLTFNALPAQGKWISVSAPLAAWTAGDFKFNNTPKAAVSTMTSGASSSITWTSASASYPFVKGDGFIYQVDPGTVPTGWSGEKIFPTGNFTLVDQSFEYSKTLPAFSASHFTLLGNPFNENLPFETFAADNGSTVSGAGYYTVKGTGGSNIVYQSNDDESYVLPWQGFIVQNVDGGTVQFNVPGTVLSPIGAPSSVASSKLKVTASNSYGSFYTTVKQNQHGNSAAICEYDLGFIDNGAIEFPQIYSVKNDVLLGVNTIGASDENVTVPLGILVSSGGDFTLTFAGMDSYSSNISLIDNQTGSVVDLTGLSSYDYQTSLSGSSSSRFALQFGRTPTGTVSLDKSNIQAFVTDGHIRIVSTDELQSVKIYSVSGSEVADLSVSGVSYDVPGKLPSGVYLVQVSTADTTSTQKVVLK